MNVCISMTDHLCIVVDSNFIVLLVIFAALFLIPNPLSHFSLSLSLSLFLSLLLQTPLSQAQVALLTKYLLVGKHCYETRNFATAMQVLCGLENVIVRQLPVRMHLIKNLFKQTPLISQLSSSELFLSAELDKW